MASNDRPVFFISSSMSELAEERGVVRKAVAKFADGTYETFCFEEDAVAQGGSPQDVWREQLGRTDTTIGLLYRKMGQYTEEELRISRQRGIPILLFRKKDKEKVLERDAADFIAWLEDAEHGITAKYFKTPKQLKQHVKEALARQQKELFSVARGARRSGTISVDGVELAEEARPKIGRRTDPPDRLRRQRVFVGRAAETTRLLGAIDRARDTDKRHVVIVGPAGIGKRALLRHVTHSDELEQFPDGTAVHPNWKEREDLEDLRQALWEQFYDTHNTVDPRTRDRQLGEIEALVFLPAVDDDADIDDLVDETMPRSVFCTSRRAISTPVVPVKLSGLTEDDDLLAVFEQHYGDVPDEAQAAIVELCRSTAGNPGTIELLATQAMMDAPDDGDADSARRLAAWAADATPGGDATPEEQRVLRVVRDVGDVDTPREVLAEVVGSIEPVDRALDRGHLRSASPRYRLNPVLDGDAATVPADGSVMPEVFAGTLGWVGGATHAEIFANRTFIVRMLSWAAEQERWRDVIALGRAAEASLAMGGRHGAWREVLELVATAARRLDPVDEETLAWALHQLGSRSLLRDELDDGRAQLFESFRLRRDDDDARDLTRRNLKLLPAAVLPWYALVLATVLVLTMVGSPEEERVPDIGVAFGRVASPTIETTPELELTGGGDGGDPVTVTIDDAMIDGAEIPVEASGFCIVGDPQCPAVDPPASDVAPQPCPVVGSDGGSPTVDIGEPCAIAIGFTPTAESGQFEATLLLTTADETLEGTVEAEVDEAIVEVDPDWHEFGQPPDDQIFTVTNVGNVTIDVGAPTVRRLWEDEPSDDYRIVDANCGLLEPSQQCTVHVESNGTESGFLEFGFTSVDDAPTTVDAVDAVDAVGPVVGSGRVLLVGP